jgi:hypothetical protein
VSARARAGRRMQPQREYLQSKSKEMKTNESKIAFISFHLFFRNLTFQRVTSKKIKKSLPRCARV